MSMKKLMIAAVSVMLMVSLSACGSAAEKQTADTGIYHQKETTQEAGSETVIAKETIKEEPTSADNEGATVTVNRTLVVWFSCTNHTAPLAEYAAACLNADLYEIVPEQPYTEEDINYNVDDCRANREQNDPDSRPEISGELLDMSLYSTIILAHPIWWGEEARIIDTFLESYNFAGKTMAEFVTSGGSGVDTAYAHVQKLAPDAVWVGAKRFQTGASEEEVADWLSEIGLN